MRLGGGEGSVVVRAAAAKLNLPTEKRFFPPQLNLKGSSATFGGKTRTLHFIPLFSIIALHCIGFHSKTVGGVISLRLPGVKWHCTWRLLSRIHERMGDVHTRSSAKAATGGDQEESKGNGEENITRINTSKKEKIKMRVGAFFNYYKDSRIPTRWPCLVVALTILSTLGIVLGLT